MPLSSSMIRDAAMTPFPSVSLEPGVFVLVSLVVRAVGRPGQIAGFRARVSR